MVRGKRFGHGSGAGAGAIAAGYRDDRFPLSRLILSLGGLVRLAGVLAAVLACLALLSPRLADIDAGAVFAAARSVPVAAWALALAATLVSFAAIGGYDVLVHRQLATGIDGRTARLSGMAAVAFGQMLGFGLVTGALVRWRLCPGLGVGGALRVTAAVTATFVSGWAVLAALVLLGSGGGSGGPAAPRLAAWLVLALAAAALAIARWRPALARRLRLPPPAAMLAALALTLADCLGAMLAFAAIAVPAAGLGGPAVAPAFLLALGAGLVSGAPGGVGPFDAVLAALLP